MLSPFPMWLIEIRLLGALAITSIGDSVPIARIFPVSTRLPIFRMASSPPTALTDFSITSSAFGGAAPAGAGRRASLCTGASDSSTGGVLDGWVAAWWHEKQVICCRPLKLDLLMEAVMAIISRAVFLGALSSASNLPCTWQNEHSTPSDVAMNCMAGPTWSAGTSFITVMFLYTSAAVLVPAVLFSAVWACSQTAPVAMAAIVSLRMFFPSDGPRSGGMASLYNLADRHRGASLRLQRAPPGAYFSSRICWLKYRSYPISPI